MAPLAIGPQDGLEVVVRVGDRITGAAVTHLEVQHAGPRAVGDVVRVAAARHEAGSHAGGSSAVSRASARSRG